MLIVTTPDMFPAELAAAQAALTAAQPYEPVHCVAEDEFYLDEIADTFTDEELYDDSPVMEGP
jgi:hypothetical protein